MDLSEFESSLVYKVSSRSARVVIQRNPVSEGEWRNMGDYTDFTQILYHFTQEI